jgi:hypothetical protein
VPQADDKDDQGTEKIGQEFPELQVEILPWLTDHPIDEIFHGDLLDPACIQAFSPHFLMR